MRDLLLRVPRWARWPIAVCVAVAAACVAVAALPVESFWPAFVIGFPFGWAGSRLGHRWARMEASR